MPRPHSQREPRAAEDDKKQPPAEKDKGKDTTQGPAPTEDKDKGGGKGGKK